MKAAELIYLIAILIFFQGCVPYRSIVNYDEAPKVEALPKAITNYTPILIHPDDLLQISISSVDPLAVTPFNRGASLTDQSSDGGAGVAISNYLVDKQGSIVFPTIGKIKLAGLTTEEAANQLLEKLKPYFKEDPIVNLRLGNFKISVSGEVNRPGTFPIPSERVTILEAIIMAGDFNPYSMRDSVMIIREQNNERNFGYVDFNSAEVFSSPYFYLKQNDVVYVRPQKSKMGSIRNPASNYLPWVTAFTSVMVLIISITRR